MVEWCRPGWCSSCAWILIPSARVLEWLEIVIVIRPNPGCLFAMNPGGAIPERAFVLEEFISRRPAVGIRDRVGDLCIIC